jgi:hypothetical protein
MEAPPPLPPRACATAAGPAPGARALAWCARPQGRAGAGACASRPRRNLPPPRLAGPRQPMDHHAGLHRARHRPSRGPCGTSTPLPLPGAAPPPPPRRLSGNLPPHHHRCCSAMYLFVCFVSPCRSSSSSTPPRTRPLLRSPGCSGAARGLPSPPVPPPFQAVVPPAAGRQASSPSGVHALRCLPRTTPPSPPPLL